MTDTEIKLAKKWYIEDNEGTATIAKRLGRDRSTITRLVIKRLARRAQGRPQALTSAVLDRLEKRLSEMIMKVTSAAERTPRGLMLIESRFGWRRSGMSVVAVGARVWRQIWRGQEPCSARILGCKKIKNKGFGEECA